MKHPTIFLTGLLMLITACTPKTAQVNVSVYFTNMSRYAVGTEPYEDPVTRTAAQTGSLPETVLTQLFLGPTPQEKAQGLDLVLSGTTAYKQFIITNGVAHVYLTGKCNSGGSTYTIGNLVFANLAQFPKIQWIKIYDESGQTESPNGQSSSIPFCLEP